MFHHALQAGIRRAGLLDILQLNGCLSDCLGWAPHRIKTIFFVKQGILLILMKDLNHHLHWLIPNSCTRGRGQMVLFIMMTLQLINYHSLQTFSQLERKYCQGGC